MANIPPLLYFFVHAVLALCWGNLLYISSRHDTLTPLDAVAVLLGAAMAAIQISAVIDDLREQTRALKEKNTHDEADID